MAIKDILKNRRIELHLTMKEVADKVGVSEGTISRWESGDIANMRRDKIMALAKALQISPAVIMEWEDDAIVPTDGHTDVYYLNPETAKTAQKIFDDPNYRMLFDAASDARPEDLQMAAEMLRRFKEARNE